ncbi:MAG: AmmeMemoRadiSam system protein A [Candidatus Acidiferrales bacterium]
MCPLGSEEKKILLGIARKAIALTFTEGRQLEIAAPEGALAARGGAFVTLRKRGRLRGCIGRLSPEESLASVVAYCAAAAATEDPRFSRLRADEFGELEIEISVLSELQKAQPEQVEAGMHGLVISRNGHRGVLLPQVAREHSWSRERFLEETCHKGGLNPDAWKEPETEVEIFTAETFSEADFPAGHPESTGATEK